MHTNYQNLEHVDFMCICIKTNYDFAQLKLLIVDTVPKPTINNF